MRIGGMVALSYLRVDFIRPIGEVGGFDHD